MSDAAAPSWKKNPWVTGLVGLSAGLVLAYGIGLWQRSSALGAQAEANALVIAQKDAQIAASAAELAEAQAQQRAVQSRAALTQARLAVFQALNDLDQRNFGMAGDRIREAAGFFDQVDAAAIGLDPAVLSALRAEVAGTPVLVATDLEAQRLQLLELAARIEAQSAPAAP